MLKMRSGEMHFEGQAYLLHFVLPNVFFHCTTAYNILREAGAEIGKMDFIGRCKVIDARPLPGWMPQNPP